MKTYQFLMCVIICGGVSSETNGLNFQQPSSKWAFAQSYSWLVSNYGDTFDPQTQQVQTQAQMQQALQQQALEQQARQAQQALQQQALQGQIQQQMQQQALQAQIQQQIQQQALKAHVQQQAEVARLQRKKQTVPFNRYNSQSNSIGDYTIPNEPNGHVLRNAQTENMAPLPVQRNENTQEFIDEIVRKVIQETRGELTLYWK